MLKGKTDRFPREKPIDCTQWAEFTILSVSMHDVRIYYVARQPDEEIDKTNRDAIESGHPRATRPAENL